MMTRNEVDIIDEVLASWRSFGVPILALDDSDDGTFERLLSDGNVSVFRQRDRFPGRHRGALHWMYQDLLDEARTRFGEATWVLLGLGDEIWLHDPIKIVTAMAAEGADTLTCRMCNHLLHPDDRSRWDFEAHEWRAPFDRAPLVERIPYYTAHWFEHRGFLDRPGLAYDRRSPLGVLPPNLVPREFSRHPLIRHHSIRSPLQAIARASDRVDRRFQEAYRPYYYRKAERDVFYESFYDGSIVLRKFSGTYEEYESGLEDLRSSVTRL
jgi:hypothetical protein